ncbi:hypothetical protein SRABI128_05010 [Microbacterium sp. Bi128]|nr:hypothetical protein SRABI128_05010 [Microbacterium sp. Bi128]
MDSRIRRPPASYIHSETAEGSHGSPFRVVAAETIWPAPSYPYWVTVPARVRAVIRPSSSRPIRVTSVESGSERSVRLCSDRLP